MSLILGGLAGEDDGGRDDPRGNDGVIAPMARAATPFTFLFDVAYFAAGRHLAVPANDAAATESGESEKPYETH